MIKRLRPLPSPDDLAAMYATPHDHLRYGRGHCERVAMTIALARLSLHYEHCRRVIDLSCGNGEIARRIVAEGGDLHLGDFLGLPTMGVPGEHGYVGPIEETIYRLPEMPWGDTVWVLSETLEHLDDPETVLGLIRQRAKWLVLSTPLDCWEDTNTEHLWAWDRGGVEELAERTGWGANDGSFLDLDTRPWGEPYRYGMWVLS